MNPGKEYLEQQYMEVRDALNAGQSVEDAHQISGLSIKSVYRLAHRENLPTNPSVGPNSLREQQLVYMAYQQYPVEVIGARFKMSPAAVETVLDGVRQRAKPVHTSG